MKVKIAEIKPAIMMLATIINTMTYVKEYDNYRWPRKGRVSSKLLLPYGIIVGRKVKRDREIEITRII